MGFYYSFWIFRFENKLNWTKIHTSLVCCVRHSKSILRTICFGRIYNSVHVDRWNTRIRFRLTEYNLIDMFFMIKSVEWPLGIHCVLITLDGYSGSSSARRLFRAFFIWNELIANSFKTSFREYVRRRSYRFHFCSKTRNSCWMANIALAQISPQLQLLSSPSSTLTNL